jgi:hypothetical protein
VDIKKMIWAGRIMSGLATLFLLLDAVIGAVATNVRVNALLFSYVLTQVYVGVLLWEDSTCATSACERLFRLGGSWLPTRAAAAVKGDHPTKSS